MFLNLQIQLSIFSTHTIFHNIKKSKIILPNNLDVSCFTLIGFKIATLIPIGDEDLNFEEFSEVTKIKVIFMSPNK